MENGLIVFPPGSTQDQLANMFSKCLSKARLGLLYCKHGLKNQDIGDISRYHRGSIQNEANISLKHFTVEYIEILGYIHFIVTLWLNIMDISTIYRRYFGYKQDIDKACCFVFLCYLQRLQLCHFILKKIARLHTSVPLKIYIINICNI